MNTTTNLIKILDTVTEGALFESARFDALMCLLDHIACTECGRSLFTNHVEKYLSYFDDGKSLKDMAFLRGYMGHVLELDDGHRGSMSHPGSVVLGALLPVCAKKNVSGKNMMKGIVAGYEAAIRTGMSVQPGHKKRGFHTSATSGTIGGAMAIAYACGYTPEQKLCTLAAAVTCSSGTLALQDDDSEMKPVNIGTAAANGVLAAQVGSMGLRAPLDPIGGKRGFMDIYSDTRKESVFDPDNVTAPLIKTIYRKKHAACRHAHAPIDCILSIRGENPKIVNDLEDIRQITVGTYDLAINGHDATEWSNPSGARLSIPYCAARAVLDGEVGIDAFSEEASSDTAAGALAKRVKVVEDKTFTAALPDMRGAQVSIEMADGKVYNNKVERPLGEPENPLEIQDIEATAAALFERAGEEHPVKIIAMIEQSMFEPSELYELIMK